MAENRAPNAAEFSPAVIDLDSDQADRGAALATPATKKLKLSYKHFAWISNTYQVAACACSHNE